MSEWLMLLLIFVLAFGWVVLAAVGMISGLWLGTIKDAINNKLRRTVQRLYYRKKRKDQLKRAQLIRSRLIEQEVRADYYGEL